MDVSMPSTFSFIDYGVFSLVLIVSALIGFYYAWTERNNKSVDRILLGERKLKTFPVAMSIMASFTSAVSVLGFSREMYQFGSMYMLIGFSYFLTQPLAAALFVPFFYRLNVTSAYEYLERRFNYGVRFIASIVFCIEMFLYMAVVLYSPALTIQQVTGIPLWVSITLTGFVCTIYTSLGGMKAVVFTDTFQVFVMFAGLFAIIIEGTRRVGSIGIVLKRYIEADRLEFFDFNPSPFERHTFWSIMIGGFFTSLTVYGSNQATIQRYFSLPSIRAAQKAMYWNLLGTYCILIFCCCCGIVCFAFYYGCDPFLSGKIYRYDQILPYFVMDILRDYQGLPGLFIACVYSAALSTVSSGLNSLVAVCLHDFIYPLNSYMRDTNLTPKTSMILSKVLAAVFGLVTIGLSFLCEHVGSTVLQISLSIFGILGGPLLGVICLGMFVPFANSYGATLGLLLSFSINLWLAVGSNLYGKRPTSKPFRTDLCENTNYTTTTSPLVVQQSQNVTNESSYQGFYQIYDISYYWFSLIGIFVVMFVGITTSLLVKPKNKKVLEPNLTVNLTRKIGMSCTKFFSCRKQNGFINEEKHAAEATLLSPSIIDTKL